MNRPRQIKRSELPPGKTLCDYCTGKCCQYFALPIETPDDYQGYEYLRWYLLHDRASVFVEDEIWYLLVHTTCKHLEPDHRCGIYQTRPQICREYSTTDCEFDDNYTYEQYFELPEQIAEYCDAAFANHPSHPNFRSPKPGLPIVYAMPDQAGCSNRDEFA